MKWLILLVLLAFAADAQVLTNASKLKGKPPCSATIMRNCIPNADARGNVWMGATLPAGAPSGTLGVNVVYSPNDALNVKAFGAKGDGTTNDNAAFVAAIAAADQGGRAGGSVYVPPGTYPIGNLSLPANVSMMGAGAASTLLGPTSGVMVTMASSPSGKMLKDLTFNCANVATTAVLDNGNGSMRHDNISALRCPGYSMIYSATQNSLITNLYIWGGGGIQLAAGSNGGAGNNIFSKIEVASSSFSPASTTARSLDALQVNGEANIFDQVIVEYAPGWAQLFHVVAGIQNECRLCEFIATSSPG